jgi:hypothetical protein
VGSYPDMVSDQDTSIEDRVPAHARVRADDHSGPDEHAFLEHRRSRHMRARVHDCRESQPGSRNLFCEEVTTRGPDRGQRKVGIRVPTDISDPMEGSPRAFFRNESD